MVARFLNLHLHLIATPQKQGMSNTMIIIILIMMIIVTLIMTNIVMMMVMVIIFLAANQHALLLKIRKILTKFDKTEQN